MPQTYGFQISTPVTDTLPRNRIVNMIHMQHVVGALSETDLGAMCADIVELYATRYGNPNSEILCKAYDTDAKPNYPRATVIVNAGVPWSQTVPRELALCLSYAGENRGNKSERGRMYLNPMMKAPATIPGLRPDTQTMQWALDWYTLSNESLPDLGGVDWQFGIWSKTYNKFTKSTQAWCNDDWDIQRRRGLRESTRLTAIREG